MFKALTPLFALLVAAGLVFTYVRPTLTDMKSVQSQVNDYQDAIDKAGQLKTELAAKAAQKQAFTLVDTERLKTLLPDTVDEVSTLLDLDTLAQSYRISLSGISVKKQEDIAGAASKQVVNRSDLAPTTGSMRQVVPQAQQNVPPAQGQNVSTPDVPYKNIDLSFTAVGTYVDFRSFLQKLEQSLAFYDVTSLKFVAHEGELGTYQMTIRTYAFNPGK